MDRISSLPEELLCHVLSFLTTKHAASTSVLSKRWRNLFAFVPNLDLDDSVFLHREKGRRKRNRVAESFMDFVDRVLALQCNSPIKKFSFKFNTYVDEDDENRVDRWICTVLQRGVLDLDLSIGLQTTYMISSDIFNCKTLVKLKIAILATFNLRAANISLPMLKTLVLDSVWFSTGELQKLVSACPALEELDIGEIHYIDPTKTISSESLKTVTINSESFFQIKLFETPNLICLKCYGSFDDGHPLVNLQNLVEAQIKLRLPNDQMDQADDVSPRVLGNVQKVVRDISNVQKLYLSHGTLKGLSLCCDSIPVFKNLKLLRIESASDRGWKSMLVLLSNCPYLKTLIIENLLHCITDKCGDACNCTPREEKSHSLISCPVKRLVIREFRGTCREMYMIEHFLKSFRCVKEMEIYHGRLLITPRVLEFIAKMQMQYNDLSSCNVKFQVHGSFTRK